MSKTTEYSQAEKIILLLASQDLLKKKNNLKSIEHSRIKEIHSSLSIKVC